MSKRELHGNSLDIECPVCHAAVGVLCSGARSTEHVARTRAYWATQPTEYRTTRDDEERGEG